MERNNQHRINFQQLRSLWRNPSISPGAKAVLFDLLLYAGVDGSSFPSHITLANDLGRSDRQIRTYLKELASLDLVGWAKGSFGKSNSYSFNPEIYFHIDKPSRKPTSTLPGTVIPSSSGSQSPSNVVIKLSQRNESDFAGKNQLSKIGYPEYNLEIQPQPKPQSQKHSDQDNSYQLVDPDSFSPEGANETAAWEIWGRLEPNNKKAFITTYMFAVRNGVSADELYRFESEIKADSTIQNKGAVMNKKIRDRIKELNP